ncbi:MAG: PAS domain S-box protein [Synechococcales bacterium]|nr:PAS domain S-box protein [Synechococcales bacterium]
MANRQRWFNLFKARLSRKIVYWVFISIVVIEAIILIPSVYRRERELLSYLRELSAARAAGVLATKDLDADDEQLLGYLTNIQENLVVLGGALYRQDGTLVGTFGDPPDLTFADLTNRSDRYNRRTHRYDAAWDMSPLQGRHVLIIRHDAVGVSREFYAFIGRITGLVVIISIFVTVATLVVLERILITPILTLRRDLLRAGTVLGHEDNGVPPEFESVKHIRSDELGEVTAAFDQMVRQISEAIAERDQAEADLRCSEEKFSKAFRASPDAVTLSTLAEGRLIEVNDSFLELANATRQEVIGQTVTELGLWVKQSDRNEILDMLHNAGCVRNQEYCFRTLTGEKKTALYSCELIRINGQDCILSVIHDITERKRAEQAVRDSEMRFRTLVEQAADAFFVVNAAGQIEDVNQQACNALGYSCEELMHLTVPDVQEHMTLDEFRRAWAQLAPGHPINFEGLHRRKDGSLFPVEVRLGLLDLGDTQLALALARDITERKQAEQVMARLAEIGELASMIVHEVRNPLTTVLMGLSSFKRMDLPERAQARLALALEESERLQRLLNEILMYAKDQRLEVDELDLNALMLDLLETLRTMPSASDRHIDYQSLVTPALIKGDRDKLKQVFINLISNACEAVPPGGVVTWQTDENGSVNHIRVRVHNGGEPIPPEVLPNLTKPFFTTKSSGNGLGLAITKRIVEAHQGSLTIESSAEAGTTVTVTLPKAMG